MRVNQGIDFAISASETKDSKPHSPNNRYSGYIQNGILHLMNAILNTTNHEGKGAKSSD